MICLDTNAVIAAINRRIPHVRGRLEDALVAGVTVGIPAIALYGIWYGIRKSARPRANAAALAVFLTLDVTPGRSIRTTPRRRATSGAALERAGTPIGPHDLLIAAQARRRGALLVTANAREFARVPGLRTEDWAAG